MSTSRKNRVDLSVWVPIALLAVCVLLLGLKPDFIAAVIAAIVVWFTIEVLRLNRRIRRLSMQEQAAENEKKLLIESIECAPLAFAVYGPDDRLLAWNKSYERFYPETFARFHQVPDAARPRYADLLKESVPSEVPADKVDEYIAQRVKDQRSAKGIPVDRHYPTGGWRRVTKFVTPNGAVAGFAVDISALKAQEAALQSEIERRQAVEIELKKLATTDSLTNSLNRRAFMAGVQGEIDRFKRYRVPTSLILFDIDWFKAINDKFGHQTGDDVLIAIVNAAQESTRHNIDKIGRIGGEEFGLLLPHTDLSGALSCADQLRERIAALQLKSEDGTRICVTASFGISLLDNENMTLTSLIGQADQAMYESKRLGRNRITAYKQAEPA